MIWTILLTYAKLELTLVGCTLYWAWREPSDVPQARVHRGR